MYFRHNVDDTIEINGVKFEYETFLDVEPDYTKPVGMSWRHYEQGSYHQIHTIGWIPNRRRVSLGRW